MDSIPFDPALGSLIDPALTGALDSWEGATTTLDVPLYQDSSLANYAGPSYMSSAFSQGPLGDPFAFSPLEPPRDPSPEEPPPLLKRKSKPTQKLECQTCLGDDNYNQHHEPEQLVSCTDCSKRWHPSCTELADTVPNIYQYDWTCNKCKRCAICASRSKPAQMILCDKCDRGYHRTCLNPPMSKIPDGAWHCSDCPEVEEPESLSDDGRPKELRDTSEASSVSAKQRKTPKSKRRKSRPAAHLIIDDSDPEPVTPSGRRKGKGKTEPAENDMDFDEPPPKRIRRVKLRLPRNPASGATGKDDTPRRAMFEDLLSATDRDTSRTSITGSDKNLFERSRRLADQKSLPPPPSALPLGDLDDFSEAGPFRLRRSHFAPTTPVQPVTSSDSPTPGPSSLPTYTSGTLRIKTIRFGEYDIKTWYSAPFPEEYANIPDGRLWICEYCLKYMKSGFGMDRHRMKCKARHPPGDEIYRDGRISVFEVDGRRNKIYCQNLCLLSKMFLDHKSLFYDVEPFLFYVITELDREESMGAKFVGYFSKEKRSPKNYNLSCIMTLPVRQRQGWGNFLMDFSYLLSKKEQLLGSPEKPLSSLGALGYRTYWTLAIMRYFETAPDHPRLDDICAATSMTKQDVFNTLVHLDMIKTPPSAPTIVRPSPGQAIRVYRGRGRGFARKNLARTQSVMTDNEKSEQQSGPFIPPARYLITFDRGKVDEHLRKWEGKAYLRLKPEKLQWSPYLLSRVPKTQAVESTHVADLVTLDTLPPDDVSHLYDPSEDPDPLLVRQNSFASGSIPGTPGTPGRRRTRPSRAHAFGDGSPLRQLVDGNDALASKLATGESSPRRLLTRSTSGVGLDVVMSSSPDSTPRRSAPPRKRRRIESSPELEDAEEEQDEDGDSYKSSAPGDSSSLLGSEFGGSSDPPPSPEAISRRPSRRLSTKASSSPGLYAVPDTTATNESSRHTRSRTTTAIHHDSERPPNHVPLLDNEDTNASPFSPATSVQPQQTNGRHSVVPSDDTVVASSGHEVKTESALTPLPIATDDPPHAGVKAVTPYFDEDIEMCDEDAEGESDDEYL